MSFIDPIENDEFDPNAVAYEGETPPFEEIIFTAIDTALKELHTWLPAKVIAINPLTDTVTLQPLLQRLFNTQTTAVDLPAIQNVPVISPRGGDYFIKLPVAVGDLGIALFCERSLDAWLSGDGSSVDPADARFHHLADPVFVPGLYPFAKPILPSTSPTTLTDMVITNGFATITLQKAGTFLVKNKNVELIDILDKIAAQIIATNAQLTLAMVNTLMGPQPLLNAPAFAAIQAQLEALQVLLETLKGI